MYTLWHVMLYPNGQQFVIRCCLVSRCSVDFFIILVTEADIFFWTQFAYF